MDPRSAEHVLRLLREAADQTGQTVVLVTHDPRVAAWADTALFLQAGRIAHTLANPTVQSVLACWDTL